MIDTCTASQLSSLYNDDQNYFVKDDLLWVATCLIVKITRNTHTYITYTCNIITHIHTYCICILLWCVIITRLRAIRIFAVKRTRGLLTVLISLVKWYEKEKRKELIKDKKLYGNTCSCLINVQTILNLHADYWTKKHVIWKKKFF